jgi:hypothetical protein
LRRCRGRSIEFAGRKFEPKEAPLAFRAGDPQFAAEQTYNALTDVKAKSDASARLVIVTRLIKRLEQVLEIGGRYPFTGVSDFESDAINDAMDGQRYFTAVGEFNRIPY